VRRDVVLRVCSLTTPDAAIQESVLSSVAEVAVVGVAQLEGLAKSAADGSLPTAHVLHLVQTVFPACARPMLSRSDELVRAFSWLRSRGGRGRSARPRAPQT
jgi:hypothetical protein